MAEMIKLEEMTFPEIRAAIDHGMDTVVFGVGSNEQHGPVLPMCTDKVQADTIAYLVAQKLGNALKGPPIPIGCSDHHMKFAGTISLRKETLQNVIRDYCASLAKHGFSRIIIIPFHGGNFGPLEEIRDELQNAHPNVQIFAYTNLQEVIDIMHETSAKFGISKEDSGAHAGEFEVSLMMWARGDLVRMDKIPESTGFLGDHTEKELTKMIEEGIDTFSPIGVTGSPDKSSADHGKIYFEALVSTVIEYISKTE